MRDLFLKNKKTFFLFFFLTFLFYGNSLKNKYSLDDDYVTVTNFPRKGQQYIPNHNLVSKGFKGIIKIWKSRYAHDSEGAFDYRPVTTTTFAIEYGIFGQNPTISHLINILLFLSNVWLLFSVLLKLLEKKENNFNIAFLCSILFLIHPIHTEVVDNLKCRDELLSLTFGLLALWYSIKIYDNPNYKNFILIILFLLLGVFSKQTAILFLAIIPLSFFFFREIRIKNLSYFLISFIIIFVSIHFIRTNFVTEASFRNFYHFENPLFTEHVTFFQKTIIGIKTFGFYVIFSVFPYPLRFYYGTNMFDLSSSLNIYFFIALSFIIFCVWYIYKFKNKLLLFAFLIFSGCIFPFINIGTPAPGILGERFAYYSSFGFCLILAILISKKIKILTYNSFSQFISKPLVYLLPLIFICMIYIWNRNSDWYNKLTLFEADIKYQENSAKAHSLIANEYFEMLNSQNKKYPTNVLIEKCIKHYTQAVKNDSTLYSAYNNVGVVYYNYLNDINNAKKFFNLAIAHRDKYSQAYENLGNCYKREKNIQKSYEAYKQAILFNQKQYTAYTALIDLLFSQKQYDKTLNIISLSEKQFPNSYELTVQKANCYLIKKDTLESIKYYEAAYKINPNQNLAQFINQKHKETGNRSNN